MSSGQPPPASSRLRNLRTRGLLLAALLAAVPALDTLAQLSGNLLSIPAPWRFRQGVNLDGVNWKAPLFNDASWPIGQTLFYSTSNNLPAPKLTLLSLGNPTYYFRTHFSFSDDPSTVGLTASCLIDDGAIFYLNGVEAGRVGMPDGPIQHATRATRNVTDATNFTLVTLCSENLFFGDNVLAVEVHQTSGALTDVVFGLSLAAQPSLGVGFVNVSLQPGLNLIANPLERCGNVLTNVLPSAPLGAQLIKFNNDTGRYEPANTFQPEGWSHPTQTFSPGEGAFFYTPEAATLTFIGEANLEASPIHVQSPVLLSSRILLAGPAWETVTRLPPPSDRLLTVSKWNSFQQHYDSYPFDPEAGGWVLGEPQISPGEAAWFEAIGGALPFPPPPLIVSQPASLTVPAGTTASFTAEAVGIPPLQYQWYFNHVPIPGALENIYAILAVQPVDAGDYFVVVNNPGGSVTSSVATLTVPVPPQILMQPQGQIVCPGADVTLQVLATGSAPLRYQWFRNGVPLPNGTNAQLTISGAGPEHTGNYFVLVSNPFGLQPSTEATLGLHALTTVSGPAPAAACPGTPATFLVTVFGSAPVTYQWSRNGVSINNATNSLFTLAAVTPADAGLYSVVVASVCSRVTNSAPLAVLQLTTATALTDITRVQGQTATFTTTASGAGPFTYAWFQNGTPLAGQTNSSLTLASVTPANAGTYTVIVRGLCNSVTNRATLLILVPPTITTQPVNLTVTNCQPASFRVVVQGTPPFSYQWSRNGQTVSGATNDLLNLANTDLSQTGDYRVAVTGPGGSATSQVARLDVVNLAPTIAVAPDRIEPAAPGACFVSSLALSPPAASDECGPIQVISNAPSQFPVGTTEVLWTAIDRHGLTATSTQRVIVRDVEAPVITCPPTLVVEWAGGTGGVGTPVQFLAPTAVDTCDPAPTLISAPASGALFPLGDTPVLSTATDRSGNSSQCTFLVRVVDTTPPRICAPAPILRENGGQGGPPNPAFPRPQLIAALPGQPLRGFDDCAAGGAAFVHSFDALPECITSARLRLRLSTCGGGSLDDTIALGFADAQGFHTVFSRPIGQAQPNGDPGLLPFPWTGEVSAEISLDLARLPAVGGGAAPVDAIPGLVQNRFLDLLIGNDTAVDYASLEFESCRCQPDLKVPTDPGQPGAIVTFAPPPVTDTCDPAPRVSATPASGTVFALGNTPVAFTAVDSAGNSSRCWFTVIVCDTEPPQVQCPEITLVCPKPSGAPVFFSPTATDNSGVVRVQCAPPSGSVFPLGTTFVNCSATDSSTNSSHCRFPVTLLSRAPPTVANVTRTPTNFTFSVDTQRTLEYAVEYKNSLGAASWDPLLRLLGTGEPIAVTDPAPPGSNRFYRAVLLNPPPETPPRIAGPPRPPPALPSQGGEPCRPVCGPPYVHTHSGAARLEVTDLKIEARGEIHFEWRRTYQSCVCVLTPLGYGWDFSYNICIVPNGPDLDLLDGQGRQDTYFRQPDGSFVADEFFREGRFAENGEFILTFASGGTWEFLPLDGRPAQGRVARIRDRNGNTMSFTYNPSSQLIRITDPLNREITVSYHPEGLIAAVTDFAGRTVRYSYYQDEEEGGSSADLKEVVGPAVVGTPTGNDFPGGKTNRYTYAKGLADERLNRNLLTVTDARGQTWLQNTYEAPPEAPCSRIVRQVWGYSNEVLTFTYLPQSPAPANGFATHKTIVNGRDGTISEYSFDADNRCVLDQAYTGQANPGNFTTDTQNRPQGRLRPTDPAAFATRREWNIDSLPTRITWPNGNVSEFVYERELNPAAPPRARGNLRICRQLPGPLGADQPRLEQFFEYAEGYSGCCAHNFVTKHTDARGHLTQHTYDPRGNRLRTIHRLPNIVEDFEYNAFGQLTARVWPDNGSGSRRRDVLVYYDSGPQQGYLAQRIEDAENLALTRTYQYDLAGHIVRTTDPRGHDTLYTVNTLGQVIRELSREVTTGSGVRYEKLFWYDANNNIVRVDVENRDENGLLQDNTHFSTLTEYEILNQPTRRLTEHGAAQLEPHMLTREAIPFPLLDAFAVTESTYNPDRLRIRTGFGEAVAGRDPFNVLDQHHDERGLLFREIRAPGSPLQSTTQFDYDGNGNLVRTSQGLEESPRVARSAYDGYDRPTRVIDPMGNVTTYHHDPNHNVVAQRVDGELLDVPGSSGNRLLSQINRAFDEMDRLIRTDEAHVNLRTQQPYGDGAATTSLVYSPNSQVLRHIDDRGHFNSTQYDTAHRPSVVIDPKGNAVTNFYDASGNRIATVELDKSDLGNPDRISVTRCFYDHLDRLTHTVDSGGGTNAYAYNSLHRRVLHTNPRGHTTRSAYDGLERLTRTVQDMNGDGPDLGAQPGDGNVDLVTTKAWDDSGRLLAEADDNGRVTRHAYDALNRRIVTRHADGTLHRIGSGPVDWPEDAPRPVLTEDFSNGHDGHDNAVATTDANGTVIITTFDLLNRPSNRTMDRAAGIGGSTYEIRAYDGCSRLSVARNDFSLITFDYDSLCNLVRETSNLETPRFPAAQDRVTTWIYDATGNAMSCAYPSGRTILRTYDALNRLQQVCDSSCAGPALAAYAYLGGDRVEQRQLGNGTLTEFSYDPARRVAGITHRKATPPGTILDQRVYRWDANSNKTNRTDALPGGPLRGHNYRYDAVNRLIRTQVGSQLNASERDTQYTLDGAGNRLNVSSDPAPGNYTLDLGTPEPADAQMNQYTATPFDTGRQYDPSGNLTSIAGGLHAGSFRYDADARLFEFNPGTPTAMTHLRDVLGRRLRTIAGASSTRFLFGNTQELEEQDASGATLAGYVYGRSPGEILAMRRGGSDYYYHADDLGSVLAVSDSSANVLERYEYGDYGEPQIIPQVQPAAAGSGSSIGNPFLFQGYRYDAGPRLYHAENRPFDPRVGRFTTRDPAGVWSNPAHLGNPLTFVAHNPWSGTMRSSRPSVLYSLSSGLAAVSAKSELGSGNANWEPRTGDCAPDDPNGALATGHWALALYASWLERGEIGCLPVYCEPPRRVPRLFPPGCACAPPLRMDTNVGPH